MKIETKFNIGEIVYFVKDHKVLEKEIKHIVVYDNGISYQFKLDRRGYADSTYEKFDNLFRTIEEARDFAVEQFKISIMLSKG